MVAVSFTDSAQLVNSGRGVEVLASTGDAELLELFIPFNNTVDIFIQSVVIGVVNYSIRGSESVGAMVSHSATSSQCRSIFCKNA